MPFFSRRKKPEALVAQYQKSSELHHSSLHEVKQELSQVESRGDPRKKEKLRSDIQEIRLLRLQPGQGDEPLRCKLDHTVISSKRHRKYKTVSYCWGQNPENGHVSIDGVPIAVNKSAIRALQRLREKSHELVIWIDAICIIQEDDAMDEKEKQVAFMSDIYRKGTTNLVWLGDCTPLDADRVSRTLQNVLANMRQATHDFKDLPWIMYGPGSKNVDGTMLDARIDLAPLLLLFSRPWFGRLWVAQEATLSQESICHLGQQTFALTDVLLVAAWLGYNSNSIPDELRYSPGRHAARSMWYLRHPRPGDMNDLFMVYTMTRDFEAKVARDYVFALLSMYEVQQPKLRIQQRLLKPSYVKNGKSLQHIFRDATRAIIEDGRHLWILHYVDANMALPGMPSWALRFDARTVDDHALVCRANGFHATANTVLQVLPCPDADVLALRGMTIGVVHYMSDLYEPQQNWDNRWHFKFMATVYSVMKKRGGDWFDDLIPTLMGGVNLKHEKVGKSDFDDFAAFLQLVEKNPRIDPSTVSGDRLSERASRWYRASSKALLHNRFFLTKDGRPGIGPSTMCLKDRVVALFGGPALFLLRPSSAGEYRLVGECYVHGCMYGDVVKERVMNRVPAEAFAIR
ncbi:hypothetical protein CKM354_000795000 [Cercospora kikuchii]|uniref:Heterokaryon incompatibility domain-containing protein n=1 Tax=Cercospora kikuchii TaxID=84275 RepID=A0A9P3FJF1_9PEZI|nr:uncharacterized protein CKM354_000795000 [Cercospora kikuchii]GIZ44760.1 hypothetical protein CKM354_000795000 [Cercospora kikuchii]